MGHTVKTAISLDRRLLERTNALAAKLGASRSRLVAMALEEFLRRHENRRLLEQINRAHAGAPDSEDAALLDAMYAEAARLPDGEW